MVAAMLNNFGKRNTDAQKLKRTQCLDVRAGSLLKMICLKVKPKREFPLFKFHPLFSCEVGGTEQEEVEEEEQD